MMSEWPACPGRSFHGWLAGRFGAVRPVASVECDTRLGILHVNWLRTAPWLARDQRPVAAIAVNPQPARHLTFTTSSQTNITPSLSVYRRCICFDYDEVVRNAKLEVGMELIILGSITVVAIAAWSFCLTRLSCPFRRDKRESADS